MNKKTIIDARAFEILDSRGNPTVYARVSLQDGCFGYASVPSGASTSSKEAMELRDEDYSRFHGKGVLKAVSNINDRIAPVIMGLDCLDQNEIDSTLIELDGTPSKKNLGANAILAVSLAVAHASAASQGIEAYERFGQLSGIDSPCVLPMPMFNVLNGGAHASGSTDFQEFMLVPTGITDYPSALRAGSEIYAVLHDILAYDGLTTMVGDEGGFAPPGLTTKNALDYVARAIEASGYVLGDQIGIALDPAASEFFHRTDQIYRLKRDGLNLSSDEMVDMYEALVRSYPIVSIEDALAEDDWNGWVELTKRIGAEVQIVGDDIFATQEQHVERGAQTGAANAVLVKVNQVGTVTETLATMEMAKKTGWGTIVSHRSGETEDTSIADLAVGTCAGQIKAGAPARGERVAKYNRLLSICDMMGNGAIFGKSDTD